MAETESRGDPEVSRRGPPTPRPDRRHRHQDRSRRPLRRREEPLIRLLLRWMDIDDGCILVGGQDISRLRQADLRSLIAHVPQDPAMFHRTLRDNIAFARPDACDAESHRAAQAAHVTEFAEVLPDGFDTMVGELPRVRRIP